MKKPMKQVSGKSMASAVHTAACNTNGCYDQCISTKPNATVSIAMH